MDQEDKKQVNKKGNNKKSAIKAKLNNNKVQKTVKEPKNVNPIIKENPESFSPVKSQIHKEKKVLMLGWEFPPVINGGLGVACLGLSKGLSRFVDLTVILPKSDPTFIVENVELIGLNNIEIRDILKQDAYNSSDKKDFIAEQIDVSEESLPGKEQEIEIPKESSAGTVNIENSSTITEPEITRPFNPQDEKKPVTEYDTFAKTEYINIQINPYYHTTKGFSEQDSYLQNLSSKLRTPLNNGKDEHEKAENAPIISPLSSAVSMGQGEEGVTDKGNPAQPVTAARNEESVFAYAVPPINENSPGTDDDAPIKKKGQGEERDAALQTDDLMIEKFLHAFRDGELYGEDVIQKVILYSKYVLKLAEEKEFDIIYAHDWMTFLAGIEVKAKTGKPLALHVHALDYDRGGPDSKGWIFELEKYAMENADLIMPVSNYTASVIAGHYGIDPDKVFAVHNGADHVDVFKEERGFPEKLVLFLGRVTGQKGPEFFLEVASKVFESYPKVRFVVAGTGDKLKRLIETGSYRQIGHKFHFTGFLNKEKVHRLLAMTDVYCMPSVSEPFILSALEAAQFGVPMVISKQSGVAEVLSGALSADYWDVNLMAEHIISLLKSKRISSKVVKQCHEDMKSLTWDIAAEKIYNNFLKVL